MERTLVKCTRSRPPAERFVRDGSLDVVDGFSVLCIYVDERRVPEWYTGQDRDECLRKAADDGWAVAEESEEERTGRNQRRQELSLLLAAIH